MTPINSFEVTGRYRKSLCLARVLKELGVKPEEVFSITDEQWQMAADAATEENKMRGVPPKECKVNPPHSDATKQTIQLIMRRGH